MDSNGKTKHVREHVAHPIAENNNYTVMTVYSMIDLEALCGKGNVGKVNRTRTSTHILCYLEESVNETYSAEKDQ
jgi:hypothetical protein